MSSADSHSHAHPHGHGHHGHSHGRALPHPSQPMGWSILRMTLAARLTGAVAISAVLWAIVLLAMK